MNITNEDLKLFDFFRKDIFASPTIKELAKKVGKKSYAWVYNSIKKFIKMDIIKIEKKGASNICNINLDNPKTISYLVFKDKLDALSKKNIPQKDIQNLIKAVSECTPFFSFFIAGSYASGEETKGSDLDIAIIIDKSVEKKKIEAQIRKAALLMDIDCQIFSNEELLQMLANKDINYGKFLFHKRLLFYGGEAYYKILKEAIEHGFSG